MAKASSKHEKPLHIPLSFGDAVRGLLKVDPKQLKKRMAKKKAVRAKGKSNRSNQAKG
jgi:hypothetical protein